MRFPCLPRASIISASFREHNRRADYFARASIFSGNVFAIRRFFILIPDTLPALLALRINIAAPALMPEICATPDIPLSKLRERAEALLH